MNIDEGAMDFEAVMNNDKFIKAIDEAEKRVKGFSKATVSEGEKIDDVFDITTENIKIQKDVITGLESQLNSLNNEISKISPGKAQSELKQQAAEVASELGAEKDALIYLEDQVKATEKAHISFRTQLRNAREELISMEQAGLRGTDAYEALQQKVGELKDAMDDAQQQANVLANDEKGFQGVISGLSGITGAMSATQGAVGLFAGENENLTKIMLKVQSLMAITIGLQQVAQTLNKDSYFSVVLLAKGKTMLAAATTGLASALGISTVAAQALMATLTLGLSVAITAVAVIITKFIGKSNEAKKATEEFNKSVVDLSAKPIAAIKQLSIEWAALGDNMQAKEKYLQTHKNLFDELGKSINSVKKAEDLLSDPKHIQNFIDAQIAKAKALAANQQATELAKEALINDLKLEEAKKTPKVTRYISTGMYGAGYSDEIDNPEIKKLEAKSSEINNKITELYKSAIKYEQEGSVKLKNAGLEGVDEYTKGSITALENSISRLKEKYKDAATDKERANLLKQIKAQEKVLDKMDQSDSSSSKDTFKDKLDKRKQLYQNYFKWINSNDPILKKAADNEFAGMLKQGKSFLEYLKNQRDKLLSVSDQTATQKAQLKTINDMIAEETKKTVLQDFETALQKQMNSATSVLQMLDIISKKRKELSGDGSDLDTGKKEILDKADQSAQEQAQEETNKLIEDYASYLTRKLQLQQKYTDDMILLEKRLKEDKDANNPEDVAKIQGVISNRKEQYAKDNKLSGDSDYDAMIVQYRNFEQKKQAIIDEFDKKREKAEKQGNALLVNELDKAQSKALSSIANEELTNSDAWQKLFSNLDDLTISQIDVLIKEIENKFETLSDKFNPIDLNAIQAKLNEAKQIIIADNPFKSIGISIKAIFLEAGEDSKDSANNIKRNWNNLASATEKSFDFVNDAVASCEFLKDAIGDVGATAISSLSTLATVSIAVASAIKTAEKASIVLAIIQAALAVVQVIANIFTSIFAQHDKKIEKEINQHKEAVENLTEAYSDLERAVDKALGGDTYKNQKQMIANLQQQRANYLEMIRLEEDKKKTDKDKIKEYENAYKEAGQTIEDVMESISQDILQTNAKDFADQLGDALVEAFGKGEDAAKAFDSTVNEIMQNAVLNQLKKTFLEKQLQGALDSLEQSMGYWNGDNFVFDGLTDEEQARFKDQIAAISQNFNAAFDVYSDLFKDIANEVNDSSLSGGIKGVSEETASKLSGQINAMRINQAESLTVLRNQLMVLNQIAANTSYNFHLEKLTQIVDLIKSGQTDPLRSHGLS